ncbi:MAG TPA: hypothetical protein ENJ53_02345 [Phaeodactylibacter sp.]|nr:hypothetical protein [Phaeodactylibacter sp.]
MKTAIILAGGLGTRLKSVVQDIPKPMAPVRGKPFVAYVLQYLKMYGVERIIFSIGYKGEVVQEYFKKEYLSMQIDYAIEATPLGTGGGIFQAAQMCGDEPFFVLNGDTMFDINLFELEDFYHKKNAEMVIALKAMEKFDRYGVVEISETERVTAFKEKEYKEKGLINGGTYFFSKKVFEGTNFPKRFSFEKDFMEKYLEKMQMFGCELDGFFLDIGIPEDYARAEKEL